MHGKTFFVESIEENSCYFAYQVFGISRGCVGIYKLQWDCYVGFISSRWATTLQTTWLNLSFSWSKFIATVLTKWTNQVGIGLNIVTGVQCIATVCYQKILKVVFGNLLNFSAYATHTDNKITVCLRCYQAPWSTRSLNYLAPVWTSFPSHTK